jgi:hypothetical protein
LSNLNHFYLILICRMVHREGVSVFVLFPAMLGRLSSKEVPEQFDTLSTPESSQKSSHLTFENNVRDPHQVLSDYWANEEQNQRK